MTAAQRRRRALVRLAVAATATALITPHALRGDGLWFLALVVATLTVGRWLAREIGDPS